MCRASGRCRFPARVQPLWHQLSLSRRLLNGSDGSPCCAKTPASFWLRASPAYAPARLGVCNQRCVRSGLRPRVPAAPWYSAVVGGSVGQTEPAAKHSQGRRTQKQKGHACIAVDETTEVEGFTTHGSATVEDLLPTSQMSLQHFNRPTKQREPPCSAGAKLIAPENAERSRRPLPVARAAAER
jgi:hypothetical protein